MFLFIRWAGFSLNSQSPGVLNRAAEKINQV